MTTTRHPVLSLRGSAAFDDDSYVLIDNLIQVLRSYQRQNDTKIYVGRPSAPLGIPWLLLDDEKIHFLNGGAGYCISRELMEFAKVGLLNLTNHCMETGLPDDMAVGRVINTQLGVKQRFDEHFYSHFEDVRDILPRNEISKQVSFAYDTKLDRQKAMKHFPKVPVLYPLEEDPMLFRSLRAFLLKNKTSTL